MRRSWPLFLAMSLAAAAVAAQEGKSPDECREEAVRQQASDVQAAVMECLLKHSTPSAPEAAPPPRSRPVVGKPSAALVTRVKAAVGRMLRDRPSARYDDFYTVRRAGVPGTTVCGVVNAKNAFGGYSGDTLFAYRSDEDGPAVYFETDHLEAVVEFCSTK